MTFDQVVFWVLWVWVLWVFLRWVFGTVVRWVVRTVKDEWSKP